MTFSIFRYLIEHQSFRKIHSSKGFCFVVFFSIEGAAWCSLHWPVCVCGGGWAAGKQGGALEPGKGVWLKTDSCQGFPLILVIGLKNRRGCAGDGGELNRGSQGTMFRPKGQRHAAILVTQLSLATRKCSHNRF